MPLPVIVEEVYDVIQITDSMFPAELKWLCPKYRQESTYFIKDVSFALSVLNEQELNEGDDGYKLENDDGTFISNARIVYSGVGLQSKKGATIHAIGSTAIGFIPFGEKIKGVFKIAQKTIDLASKALDIYDVGSEITANAKTDYRDIQTSGDLVEEPRYNTKIEQIEKYNQLNKDAIVCLCSSNDAPLLFGMTTNEDYIRGSFTLGMTEEWNTRVCDYIQLSIVKEEKTFTSSRLTESITSGRETQTNIRDVQTKSVKLEKQHSFSMLPNGMDQFEFDAEYASDYSICIPNSSKMNVIVDGKNYTLSNNILNIYLAPGKHIITINEKSGEKITSSITIKPKEMSGTDSVKISIDANEDYLLKVNSLSSVKKLTTRYPGITIDNIFDSSWNEYNYYGSITPSEDIYKLFINGDYYIIIHNSYSYIISDTFRVLEPSLIQLDKENTISTNNTDYTFLKFEAKNEAYIITGSSSEFSNVLIIDGVSQIPSTNWTEFVEFSLSTNKTIYIGIKTKENVSKNIVKIETMASSCYVVAKTSNASYKVYDGGSIELYRGEQCTFSLCIYGKETDANFAHTNAEAFGGEYSYAFNNSTKYFCFKNDCVTGGRGVEMTVSTKNSTFKMYFYVVPKYEDVATNFSIVLFNEESLYFYYSVPAFTKNITFTIYSGSETYSYDVNRSGCIDILEALNALNIKSPRDIRIQINELTYINAAGNEVTVSANYTSNTTNSMFASGLGTSSNPYIIKYVRHFENISIYDSVYGYSNYKLANSLNLDNNTKYGTLRGTFDGNNMTIGITRRTENATRSLNQGIEKKKAKFPTSYAFKFALKDILHTKIRFIIATILCFVAFALFGITITLKSFNTENSIAKTLINRNDEYTTLGYAPSYDPYGYPIATLSHSIGKAIKQSQLDCVESYFSSDGCVKKISYGNSIRGDMLLAPRLEVRIDSLTIYNSPQDIEFYGYELASGYLPLTDDSIYITDFLAFTLIYNRNENYIYDNGERITLNSDDSIYLLVGKSFKLNGSIIKIAGILNTDYMRIVSKFADETYDINSDVEYLASKNYYTNCYVTKGFVSSKINAGSMKNGDITYYSVRYNNEDIDMREIRKLSSKEVLTSNSYTKELNIEKGQIVLSLQAYNTIFFDDKTYDYYYDNDNDIVKNYPNHLGEKISLEILYDTGEKMCDISNVEVVGVVLSEGDRLYSYAYIGDEDFDSIKEGFIQYNYIDVKVKNDYNYMKKTLSNLLKISIISENYFTEGIYGFFKTQIDFSNVFVTLGIILFFFSILIFANFVNVSIFNRKKDIGIIRAVGGTKGSIFKAFLMEGIVFATVVSILSLIATYILSVVLNNIVTSGLISGTELLIFNPITLLVVPAMCFAVMLLTTYLLVRKINKKSPVEIIRNN